MNEKLKKSLEGRERLNEIPLANFNDLGEKANQVIQEFYQRAVATTGKVVQQFPMKVRAHEIEPEKYPPEKNCTFFTNKY